MTRTKIILGVSLVIIAIGMIGWFFLKGNTNSKTSGSIGTSSAPVVAANSGSSPDQVDIGGAAPSHSASILESQVKIMGISVGGSTLKDVTTLLGNAPIHPENAGITETPQEVCYIIPKASGSSNYVIAEFLAGSAGGWKTVNIVRISEVSSGISPSCVQMKAGGEQPAVGALKLGLTMEEVKAILGTPIEIKGDEWIYRAVTFPGNTTLERSIKVYFLNGRSAQLEFTETQTM